MSEIKNSDQDFVCVLFPGIVKNDDKALQCLGGIRNISQVYSQSKKKRLSVCFQPENPYVKRIYGDIKKTAGVLLKVKVKKIKVDNEVKREVKSTSIVGRVNKIYRFESMCDFQYLPVHVEGAGSQPQCILDTIIPSGLDELQFLNASAPLFIVPSNFTRSDKPINYAYTDKRYPERKDLALEEDHIHHRRRSDRALPLNRFNFNLVDEMPSEPHSFYIEQKDAKVKLYSQLEQEFETVKKLFDERPIWSLNLIRFHTKLKISSLKIIMPSVALYLKDGPWRMLWVRYGYDPRKERAARIYQTVDFRLRQAAGVRSMVMTRDQVVHYKKADRVRHVPRRGEEAADQEVVQEGAVYFRPGMAPAQRQIYYQICDVKLPEVQLLLDPEPPEGFLCHEKYGWLSASTEQDCRDLIFKYAKQTLLASHNADMRLEQASSDDESNSDNGSSADDMAIL